MSRSLHTKVKVRANVLPRKSSTVLPLSVTDCELKSHSSRKRRFPAIPAFTTTDCEQECIFIDNMQVTAVSASVTDVVLNTQDFRKGRFSADPSVPTDCEYEIHSIESARMIEVLPPTTDSIPETCGIREKNATMLPLSVADCLLNTRDMRKRRFSVDTSVPTDCEYGIHSIESARVIEVLPPTTDSTPETCGIKEKNISSCFRFVITAGIIIGLPIHPSMVYPESKMISAFLRAVSTTIFVIRVCFIVLECVYNDLLWPSYAMRYSYQSHCLLGFFLMLIYYVKRDDIRVSLLRLEKLSLEWRKNYEKDETCLMVAIITLSFVCFALLLSFGYIFYFTTSWNFYSKQVETFSPIPEGSILVYYYDYLVVFGVLLSYHLCSATVWVTTLACSLALFTSGRLLRRLREEIESDASRGPLTATVTSRNLRSFERIFSRVRELDTAFSLCVLCVYAVVINGFYMVLSIAFSPGHGYGSSWAFAINAMIGLVSTIQFLCLTLFGDYLREMHRELQKGLVVASGEVVVWSDVRGMHSFSLLCANVRTVRLELTGLGYFGIDRRIIPSVVGVIITYGAVIYQIGIMQSKVDDELVALD